MNRKIITAAIKVNLEEVQGKYGKFKAYMVSGDTIQIKDQLKNMGFKWYGPKQAWWISEKQMTPSIRQTLDRLSGTPNQNNTTQPKIQPNIELQKTIKQEYETDNPEMTAWYGFPVKKNIYQYELPITIEEKQYNVKVSIDRSFQTGKSSDYYKVTKSREHRGLPKYIMNIEIPEIDYKQSFKKQSKEKWGSYDESQLIEELKNIIKESTDNPQSRVMHGIKFLHDVSLRTEDYKKFLDDIGNKSIESPKYNFTIDDPQYGGNYTVKIYELGMNNKVPSTTLQPVVDNPLAPKNSSFGYQNINIQHTKTIDDFHKTINDFLNEKRDFVQQEYIKFLKSFPFLDEQKDEAKESFNTVYNYINNPSSSVETILRKLQEKGYIRPSKRQRQAPGMTSGSEIKWIVNSSSIVNDAYGSSYVKRTPDYFYSVVAYYVHRQIRNISSCTDMMLVDVISSWIETMKKMGANISFKEVDRAIYIIGENIASKLRGNTEKDETTNTNKTYDSALDEFAKFVEKYEIETENIQNNAKNIYRMLVHKIHPDKFQDPIEKKLKTEEFKQLQNIWEKVPKQYKEAFNWYSIFKIS
jgi:hypothetical protein